MAHPEYIVCLECETPIYVFEWSEGRVLEAVCPLCGNDDPVAFATEDELDEMDVEETPADEGFEE
jgi:translation initiation factor 2 beta subunit (eIF-2beta)/eIF-5